MTRSLLLLALLGATACDATSTQEPITGTPDPDPLPQTTTSYLRDIQPILERSCIGCHTAGGIAPFSMDDPATVQAWAPAIQASVMAGRMPPFYASADCQSYAHDPRLNGAERQLLADWIAEGSPLGDPKEEQHASPIAAPEVRADRAMDIGGDFDARIMEGSDNYRCFAMDPQAASDLMVTGYEVVPGNRAIVHHVLAYLVAPQDLPQLEENDANDPGLGYSCMSGGVGISGAVGNQIAGWVPGGQATRFPEGTGLMLEAGSKIVIQIHYNLLALAGDTSPMDRTQLKLETAPTGSLRVARVLPMIKRNLDIAAYDANSVQTQELPVPNAAGTTVYRLTGHMHMLGKQVRLEVSHADGGSTCLLDIPAWDFNWQREYSLSEPFTLAQGDRLKITCVYDNSAAHQPVVDGVQQTPRDVTWGESSLDEMCMTYLTFTRD